MARAPSGILSRAFVSPGPTVERFLNSTALVRGIMGPQGGGKTSGAIAAQLVYAAGMPRCRDGIRRCRSIAIRETYRQLSKTTIPDWLEWVPKEAGHWQGGEDQPASHDLIWRDERGQVHFRIDFVALGENSIENTMRGFKPTIAWLNEGDTLPEGVREFVFGRLPRYPRIDDLEDGAALLPLLVEDFNAPEPGNHAIEFYGIEDDSLRPAYAAFFRQPSGLSPQAENLHNLPAGYYERQIEVWKHRSDLKRRLIENRIGFAKDGKPVYEREFNEDLHVAASDLKPDPRLPLLIGADAGRHPALVIAQETATGQLRVLAELYLGGQVGAQSFGKALVAMLEELFDGIEVDEDSCVCDPTAFNLSQDARENEAGDEQAWADIMAEVTGITFRPSECGNVLSLRIEALRSRFNANTDGQPMILISPRCVGVRKGLASGFRYRKRLGLNPGHQYEDKPEKNDSSHPIEALQYLCFKLQGGYSVQARKARRRRTQEETQFDPLAA
jgi:hypothetical protein